jgi:hypothetical protein
MAIKLNTSYSKKLGLPGFSSHSFSASVEVELGDINQAGTECARLYGLLQASVDHEIRNTGFVPDIDYGMQAPTAAPSGNGSGMLPAQNGNGNGNANNNGGGNPVNRGWNCSPKQRDLILKIIAENGLARENIDGLAGQRFGVGLSQLNKPQASGLIDELFESYGHRARSRSGSQPVEPGAADHRAAGGPGREGAA